MTNNNNNNNSIDITDKSIVNLVQQHLVHDSSTIHSEDSNNNSSSHGDSTTAAAEDTNDAASPPIDAEIPIPYHLPGAAITHDIYTHANSLVMAAHSLPRSKSFSDLKQKSGKFIRDEESGSASTSVHGGSQYDSSEEFENLDKPGGFRRFHIQQQHRLAVQPIDNINNNPAFQELFRPDSMCSAESRQDYTTGLYQTDTAGTSQHQSQPVTRHFLEYLAITSVINQFAGENLSDSEEDSQLVDDEEQLQQQQDFSEQTALLPNKRRHHFVKQQKKTEHKANITKTIFLLFKAFIGSGILFLPKAFSNGGLVFSIFTMWLMGGISLYCFLLLLDCKQHLTGSYGDMGGQLYGSWMRSIVLFSIAISQVKFIHNFIISSTKYYLY